jgi:putative transcriptional regulator
MLPEELSALYRSSDPGYDHAEQQAIVKANSVRNRNRTQRWLWLYLLAVVGPALLVVGIGLARGPELRSVLRFPGAPRFTARQIQSLDSPRAGTFLVSARGMQDPNFAQSVVLLIDYDAEGAFGLIINRPTGHTLAELWPEITGLEEHPVYFGGPVFPNRLLYLLRSDAQREGMRQVIRGVHLGSDELVLKKIIAEAEDEFRTYAGYAGWAPGQLDAEVSRGDWHILPAERRFIFAAQPGGIWNELIQRVDTQVAVLPHSRPDRDVP